MAVGSGYVLFLEFLGCVALHVQCLRVNLPTSYHPGSFVPKSRELAEISSISTW